MNPLKISLITIYMFIVFFLVLASLYDMVRCFIQPEAYYYTVVNAHPPESFKWYLKLFTPNLIVLAFCIPKVYILKRFSKASENGSIWNPIFYFAFALVVTAGVLAVIEMFDTPNIEIIENV